MEGYNPFNPDPNELFGFTKPSGTIATQPDWRVILIGGILVVVWVYWYQNSRINDLKRVVDQKKGEDI